MALQAKKPVYWTKMSFVCYMDLIFGDGSVQGSKPPGDAKFDGFVYK